MGYNILLYLNMQKIKKYISIFDSIKEYNDEWVVNYLELFEKLHSTIIQYPIDDESEDFIHLQWEPPYSKPLHNDYFYILYAMAKYCRVKLMWRSYLCNEGVKVMKVVKAIWVIGSSTRVELFSKITTEWYKGIYNYSQWIKTDVRKLREYKKSDFKSITSFIKLKCQVLENRVVGRINSKLESYYGYSIKLEAYIMGRYKLNYKNYNSDQKEYYHAVSKRFCHRRMLL